MHIYIHLTAEGYQRSFPAIWGWHWYRSYLKPMEHRPEPQIVTWDPILLSRLWVVSPAGVRWGSYQMHTGLFLAFIHCTCSELCFYMRTPNSCAGTRAVTRQFWGRGYLGFPLARLTPRHAVLFALWCSADQIILNSLQTHFVNVWLIQFKPFATTWYYRGL